jgi:2,3-dihydroxy-p-cumate/2,3-dihydroxybenzoate 3,4-dioxygenase
VRERDRSGEPPEPEATSTSRVRGALHDVSNALTVLLGWVEEAQSPDATRDEAFWTRVYNARVSDRIGAAPLLRIDAVHHRIALFPSTYAGVQHVNHQVEGIDDIMRAYYFLRERGVRIVFGPGRHPTSSAIFLYFEGPDGMVYEYSTGVRSITDEAGYRPRQFPFAPSSFCMWGSRPDIPEFRR